MPDKVRVLLADDHHVVRSGLRALIDAQSDMDVVAEVADGEAAWRKALELNPDVIVMDVSMPLVGGALATRRIKAERSEIKVLALTVHEDLSYIQQFLQAGASGYLLKRAAPDELILAIRAVAQGRSYFDSRLTGEVLSSLLGSAKPEGPQGVTLSDREEKVMQQIARGFTNREIADQLEISIKTIETHKSRAMEKLDLRSRADIVGYAIRHGWLLDT